MTASKLRAFVVWREFVVGENAGKFKSSPGYFKVALSGSGGVLVILTGYFVNAGLLLPLVIGTAWTAGRCYRNGTLVTDAEKVMWIWLLALALIDIDTMTLPNPLTQSGLIAGLAFRAVVGFSSAETFAGAAQAIMEGVVGAVLGLWLLDLIAIAGSYALGQTAMGSGDSKLAALMGAWLGWQNLLLGGFLACLLGAIAGGTGMALGLLNRRQPFPFGPFLALGGFIAAIWGNAIVSLYLKLFFPTL